MIEKELSEVEQFTAALACMAMALNTKLDAFGEPAILHLLNITMKQTDPVCRIIAVLQDSVATGICGLGEIDRMFSAEVVAGVDSLTRRDEETFTAHIDRVALNPYAIPVKIAELFQRMEIITKGQIMFGKELDEMEAYSRAIHQLMNAGTSSPESPGQLIQISNAR